MGAAFGSALFVAALFAMVAVVYAAWSVMTFAKYTLYRLLKLGRLSIREYFKIYYQKFQF
jgi:hypothetical protein